MTTGHRHGCEFLLLSARTGRHAGAGWQFVARERRMRSDDDVTDIYSARSRARGRERSRRQLGRRRPSQRGVALGRARATSRTRSRREDEPEGRALAGLARDVELAAVTLHDVLDDRQPEPGAAGLARAAAVDAIEALGQPREMLAGDAAAAVDDGDLAAAVVGARATRRRCVPPSGV